MVITILEAQVAPENTVLLEETFQQAIAQLDAGITHTFLLRSSEELSLWRILTVWESRAALDAMRQSGETPRGVLIFRAVEAEPALSVFDVINDAVSSG